MNNEITIAICVRNGRRYIAEAIASARNQSHKPSQILVIDDGSTDGTAILAEQLGCTVEIQEQLGLGAARNNAFIKAKGDYVFFLDADDLMLDNTLSELLSVLEDSTDAVGAIGFRKNFISPELLSTTLNVNERFFERELGSLPSGSLWQKDLHAKLKFNEKSNTADVEWILDFQDLKLVWTSTKATVLLRRIHHDNMSSRQDVRQDYLSLAIKRIEKRA